MFIQLKPKITEEQKSQLSSVGISCHKDDLMKLFREFSKEHVSIIDSRQIESLKNFKEKNSPGAEKVEISGFIEKEYGFKLEEISRRAGVSLDICGSWIIAQILGDDQQANQLKGKGNPKKAGDPKLKHNELADRYFGK